MDVVFIGTGDAFGAGGRRQAAILLRVPEGSLLLDCGTTTLTGLAALGIPRDSIGTIAISHFHADHFGGIPSFLLAAVHEDRRRSMHLKNAERAYLHAAKVLGKDFRIIESTRDKVLRSPSDIHQEIFAQVQKLV